MPGAGIEPAWDCSRGILSPLRLPFRHPGRADNVGDPGRGKKPWTVGHAHLPSSDRPNRFAQALQEARAVTFFEGCEIGVPGEGASPE